MDGAQFLMIQVIVLFLKMTLTTEILLERHKECQQLDEEDPQLQGYRFQLLLSQEWEPPEHLVKIDVYLHLNIIQFVGMTT